MSGSVMVHVLSFIYWESVRKYHKNRLCETILMIYQNTFYIIQYKNEIIVNCT